MKICVVGAGAIGGFIGARLAASGRTQVSAMARGATLQALREHGWRLREGDALMRHPVTAEDDARNLGVQDLIVLAVKGPALIMAAQELKPLLGPDTVVLPAMNGVPWWFCQGISALDDAPLESVDPGGCITAAIPQHHILGCVVHASTSRLEPGLVQHIKGDGLIIGEPRGQESERLLGVGALLSRAGFDVTRSANIRYDIWYKLLGNMTLNPVSAMTGATMDRALDDVLVREFCAAAMREAIAIGVRLGCEITQSPDERFDVTRKLGKFKSSMLQDVEAGRTIELDGLVSAVRELGHRVGVTTPNIDILLGLTRLFARVRGLYP